MLTQAELMSILDYDPNTGVFRWKIDGRKTKIGTIAGSVETHGYHVIGINYKLYRAHKLAWLYMTGSWPTQDIDHVNGIRNDNRFINLRECSRRQNMENLSKHRNTKSGYTGVTLHKASQKWCARIWVNYKVKYLGLYDTPEQAHQAYLDAKQKYHTFNPIPR